MQTLDDGWWHMAINQDNYVDKTKQGLTLEQDWVTFIIYLAQAYRYYFYPGGKYQLIKPGQQQLLDILSYAQMWFFGGRHDTISGLYYLWHPIILPNLAQAMTTTWGKQFFTQSFLVKVSKANVWVRW